MHFAAGGRVVQVAVANPPGPFAKHLACVDYPPTGIHRGLGQKNGFLTASGRQWLRIRQRFRKSDCGDFLHAAKTGCAVESDRGQNDHQAGKEGI